jgi:hypothetical protein
VGGLLGAVGRHLNPAFQIKPGWVLLSWGAVSGSLVAWLVAPLPWLACGAAIGAVAANLWALLCSWVEAAALQPDISALTRILCEAAQTDRCPAGPGTDTDQGQGT